MTSRLPHIGLGGEQRSLYGENSTIGEQGRRERADLEDFFADALGLGREPIRVEATVGEAIPELTSEPYHVGHAAGDD